MQSSRWWTRLSLIHISAAPGEYTRRAFLNGKLGLTQAEAVMDLISADGRQAVSYTHLDVYKRQACGHRAGS